MVKGTAIFSDIESYFNKCSKHDIEDFITLANIKLKQRFTHSNKPKYGHLSKYIPQEIFSKIVEAAPTKKLKFIFELMKALALRVGEVPEINIKNISFEENKIFIPCTEKSHMPDFCYLNQEYAEKLKNWIYDNYDEIKAHDGYIFFPDKSSNSKRLKISQDYIRNNFRESCQFANIQVCYGLAVNTGYKLNLYTTHSLRHTGITDFYIKTQDIHLTMMYARHHSISSTLHYIHQSQEDLKRAVQAVIYENRISNELAKRVEQIEGCLKNDLIRYRKEIETEQRQAITPLNKDGWQDTDDFDD